jgi:hypothetical protein
MTDADQTDFPFFQEVPYMRIFSASPSVLDLSSSEFLTMYNSLKARCDTLSARIDRVDSLSSKIPLLLRYGLNPSSVRAQNLLEKCWDILEPSLVQLLHCKYLPRINGVDFDSEGAAVLHDTGQQDLSLDYV